MGVSKMPQVTEWGVLLPGVDSLGRQTYLVVDEQGKPTAIRYLMDGELCLEQTAALIAQQLQMEDYLIVV